MAIANQSSKRIATLIRSLSGIVLIAICAGFGLLRDKDVVTTTDTPLPDLVQQSAIIAYATADTNHVPNITLTVTDIWKGTNLAQTLNVKIGSHYPFGWPADGGPMMDGAILFFSGVNGPLSPIRLKSTYVVRKGRVANMTTNEFRTKFQLQ